MMNVTVAICTWNRASLLDMTLNAMRSLQVFKDDEWELLIINNACTDSTDDISRKHADHLPIRLIHEMTPGKSHAANRAIKEARGELILWTDDDVLVDPDWMKCYIEAANDQRYDYFGGTIDPLFALTPPSWIEQNLDLLQIYAVLQLGMETRPLAEGEFVFGANMAFRADVLRKFRFDPALGPSGDNKIRNEEIELQNSMIAAGHRGLWVGSSRVRHNIPESRLSLKFVREGFRAEGRSIAIIEGPQAVPHLFGFPRPAVRQYLESRFRLLLHSHRKDRRWLKSLKRSAHLEGYLLQAKRQRREKIRSEVSTSFSSR
jgi:glycosyltransferase involved in cell wall biosynthesis